MHGLPHPFSTTIKGTELDFSFEESWVAITSTSSPPAFAAFRIISQCYKSKEEGKTKSLKTSIKEYKNYMFKYFIQGFKDQTLAASATIPGSSFAVTSFSAGREFPTKTTYKKSMVMLCLYIVRVCNFSLTSVPL